MITGQKHLITCRCVLPQFKRSQNPPQHQFTVFSVIGDDNLVKPKFSQCNNCGILHRVIDICRSEVVNRDAMNSLTTIDDIKVGLPQQLSALLESNNVDLASWEQAKFIYDNKQWGNYVVISTDEESGLRQGKYVTILGENFFKVDAFERSEVTQ